MKKPKLSRNKITYYCENRDPDFDQKMHNVLLVYKQLSLQFDENGQFLPFPEDEQVTPVLSYDEKPGIRPLPIQRRIFRRMKITKQSAETMNTNVLELFPCLPDRPANRRDDSLVRDRHSSKEYIEFLQLLDSKYPKEDKIRLVLDNLQVHTSKETRKYLAGVPGRFEFVFTPKHGSWLNLVEGFFSKLTRQS